MMEEKKMLKITDKNGIETEYEILAAFTLPETGKNYVVYTDNTDDEEGNLNVFASIYYPDDETKFDPIETEEEWNLVENMLEFLKQKDS